MEYRELVSKLKKYNKEELIEVITEIVYSTFDECDDINKYIYDKTKEILATKNQR